jgi:hypothetical protein
VTLKVEVSCSSETSVDSGLHVIIPEKMQHLIATVIYIYSSGEERKDEDPHHVECETFISFAILHLKPCGLCS